ncbi:MAG TPA: maleylpyruvate isomerase family mycothiol-dependent enzyme [Actinomycetes bacterium]|nr:maleylpyruvate isomerase family mycothiol-dependent enzyme [Actinomycetes bacterium]
MSETSTAGTSDSGDAPRRYSLTQRRYLDLVEVDAALMADTASVIDLDLAVPTCPGWTVRDALLHTAEVYQHKITCVRLGKAPEPDWPPIGWPAPGDVADPVATLRRWAGELLTELGAHPEDAHAPTWWPPDQTVGFWCRRMAHETAVHRVDVQSAAGWASPVDPELALDGIDELLGINLSWDWSDASEEDWAGVDPQAGVGLPLDLVVGERRWRVELTPTGATVAGLAGEAFDGPVAAATIAGAGSDVLLWGWGRLPDSAVTIGGDAALVAAVKDRLRLSTQ